MSGRPAGVTRRALLWSGAGLAAALGTTVTVRLTGYPDWPTRLSFLSAGQATVLAAAARAVLAPNLGANINGVVEAVDRYLVPMPPALQRDINALFAALEQSPLASGLAHRFSLLAPAVARAHLEYLDQLGSLAAQMSRGTRDLVMLGYWQQPAAWPLMGYGGPLVTDEPRARHPDYAALEAPAGATPRALAGRP